MTHEWAEFTDGVDAHLRPLVRTPAVGERTWWLSADGCTVGCVVVAIAPVHREDPQDRSSREDRVALRVVVAGSWSEE